MTEKRIADEAASQLRRETSAKDGADPSKATPAKPNAKGKGKGNAQK